MLQKKIESSAQNDGAVEHLSEAIEALRRGEVIVFPTETFYGLGADALNAAAVEQVVFLKGRDPERPIPILVADRKMLESVVADVPLIALRLMDCFWPGPLTLVLAAGKSLPEPLLNRKGGVGVRISSHPVAAHLVGALGRPLTATSANLSGKEPARTNEEALAYFSGRLKIFLDGGRLKGTKGSTVVEIVHNQWRVIREGEIPTPELAKTLR